jgi:predicted DNA-binding ribbon-helix-helix protein
MSTIALIERIDTNRAVHNLSFAIRLFVLGLFQKRAVVSGYSRTQRVR